MITTAEILSRRQRGVRLAFALACLPLLLLLLWLGYAFGVRMLQLLGYPYPLDYGEGPLLAQVAALAGGTPLPALYGDPDQPPFLVVNYPPLFHLLTLLLAWPAGSLLTAGRIVSLLAAPAALAALVVLIRPTLPGRLRSMASLPALLIILAFAALPIVREWATLMRVDLAGVALGLWGLALLPRTDTPATLRRLLPAALLLIASLFIKPSLLAAPVAACCWLFWRDRHAALRLVLLLVGSGGGILLLLNLLSNGGFWLHVVAANANPWQPLLAQGFWREQYALHWPLWLAAGLAAGLLVINGKQRQAALLPIYYTLFGAMTAFGVGKVGAYANYFLEFDAGLIWLVALAVAQISRPQHATRRVAAGLLPLLVAAALVRYYPIWSEEFLKPYGLIEGRRPARLVIGGYGVLADLARERVILSALGRVQAALATEVRAANAPIVTDIPAIAAQAGVAYRFQAFEHRQLYDTGLWDQRPLLRELANGRIPLIVLDYLGNWLTPEMITLITSRYAQDGSRGDFDLYRPLAIGSLQPLERDLGANLALRSLALAPPAAAAYSPGETLLVALALQANGASVCDATPGCALALTLADTDGFVAAEARLPLLYGVLPPRDWGGATVQQLVPLALPPALAPGRYTLQVALLASTATHGLLPVAQIEIGTAGGRLLGEQGYFVPEPILRAWVELGGYDGVGDPIMPAVPFADGIGQCFVYQCLRLQGGMVQREPLGERIALSEPVASSAAIDPAFADAYRALGGEEGLGSVLGPAFERRGMLVQYTRFARLEQPLSGGDVRRGALGIDYLRLPGGMPYRWPAPF